MLPKKIELGVTTSTGLLDKITEMLITGKLEGEDINFSVMHGDFTEEWQEAFKERLAEKLLTTTGCYVGVPSGILWQPYFVVVRQDGSTGCIKMFPNGQRIKGTRWEGGRPMVGIIVRKKGSTINIDEEVYTGVSPSLHPCGYGLIELEIDDATE